MKAIDTLTLKLHTHGGKIWYLDGDRNARCTGDAPEDFLVGKVFAGAGRIRLVGNAANARLIMYLYDLKQKHKLESVQVCTPLVCPVEKDRNRPEAMLLGMRSFTRAASLGGFHEVGEADYRSYALLVALTQGTVRGQPVGVAALQLLRGHPAWRPLSFIASLNKLAVAGLLAYMLDPRWYIDQCAPDRLGKLEAWMGLNPKTQAGVSGCSPRWRFHKRCEMVLNCWKDTRQEDAVRYRFDLEAPQPVADSPLTGIAPWDFAWRTWGYYLGLGMPDAPEGDPVIADLRGSRRFLAFLRHTWLSELYRDSPAMPEQNAALFRPADFFRHPTEIAAYELHQIKTEMI